MSTNHTSKDILPNLSVLRGFFALTVVLLHVPLMTKNQGLPAFNDWAIFNKGYNAVWGFFTLSGFLIINLLYKEKENRNDVNIKEFYSRRILRIYPVYYAVLFFGLLFYKIVLPVLQIDLQVNYSTVDALLWCVLLLPNVFFSLFDPGGILSILWSIGIEEQFYLIIAPVSKFLKSKHFTIALALFTIIYFILYFNPYTEFFRRYRFMYFYFSMGGLLAILNSQGKINFLLFKLFPRIILYVIFFIYFFTNLFEFENEVLKHLFSMVLFSLFILNISSEKRFIIENKFLNYLGTISYGIYMYHMIALNLVVFIGLKMEIVNLCGFWGSIFFLNISTIIMTIIFAHISFYSFEQFFLKLKSKFRPSIESEKKSHVSLNLK